MFSPRCTLSKNQLTKSPNCRVFQIPGLESVANTGFEPCKCLVRVNCQIKSHSLSLWTLVLHTVQNTKLQQSAHVKPNTILHKVHMFILDLNVFKVDSGQFVINSKLEECLESTFFIYLIRNHHIYTAYKMQCKMYIHKVVASYFFYRLRGLLLLIN